VEALRKDFTTLGIPDILEMALISITGKVFYSDLSKAVMNKISPFYNSLPKMTQGDNLSLVVDPTKSLIASRVSMKAILMVLTDKKIGIVLTKMRSVADKFGKLLDELIASEESKIQSVTPIPQAIAETTTTPQPEPVVEEVQQSPTVALETPATVTVSPGLQPSAPSALPLPAIVDEAITIIDEARKNGVTLRALGGMGVAIHCLSAKHSALSREYPDIDLIGHANEAGAIRKVLEGLGFELRSATCGVSPLDEAIGKVLEGLGFEPVERFNALHEAKRLKFLDKKNNIDIDVFLDVFEMCHKFDFKNRLDLDLYTISLTDLLMTKLQIVELVEKDVLDTMAILLDHAFGTADPEKIDVDYIAALCADDWGLWKTFSMNAEKISGLVDDYPLREEDKQKIRSGLVAFLKRLGDEPKTPRWEKRAKTGEKAKWYETV